MIILYLDIFQINSNAQNKLNSDNNSEKIYRISNNSKLLYVEFIY